MKILFITRPFHQGKDRYREAHSLTLLGLQKALRKQGHRVDILETKAWLPDIKNFPKLKKHYDIVHGFSGSAIMALRTWYVGKQYKAKTVHSIKSISDNIVGGYHFAWILNIIDTITVPLNLVKWKFIRRGVSPKKINVVHSSIDIKKFKPKKVKKGSIFKDKKMVLYWGAIWEKKGVDDLLEAAKQLPEINFVIIPRYDAKYYLLQLKDANCILLPNVFFLKKEASIPHYLNMCDIVVLPYRSLLNTESTPSCLLEAWACKKPVITTRLEELEEIGEDKVIWAEPNDPIDLADTIDFCSKALVGISGIADNGYKASAYFDHSFIASRYADIYKSQCIINK